MKNTNPIFSLKNFRSFGEEGADFELAPITVLTGCNGSGKSSFVKALLLLSQQSISNGVEREVIMSHESIDAILADVGTDIIKNKPSTVLKVSSKELGLGRFDKVLHRNSKDGVIIMSYRMWSEYLQEEVVVKRSFKANDDILNEGALTTLAIEKLNGTRIYISGRYTKRYLKTDENNKPLTPLEATGMIGYGWVENGFDGAIKENLKRFTEVSQYYKSRSREDFILKLAAISREKENVLSAKEENELSDLRKTIDFFEKKYGKGQLEKYSDIIMRDWNASLLSHDEEGFPIGDDDTRTLRERLGDIGITVRERNNYFNCVFNECVTPWFINGIVYIDSSSALVKRLYSIEDENKMCKVLGELVKDGKNETGTFVNKWLKEKFKIADKIKIRGTDEGIGIMAYLIKGEEERLLADDGYGITQLVSLLLQIEKCINTNRIVGKYSSFEEIGIFENANGKLTNEDTYKHHFIAIEEPEVHLHPKYQSLLADMFVEANQTYHIHFIIETHSEYLIRKLQVLVADKENKLTSNDVSLNYVDKDENGISTNRKIEILEDGRLSEPFGPGFFDEADSLAMDLIKYKVRR